jgi:predicted ATP-binding protein involved in virulence
MAETESANNGVYFLSLELENVRCFGKKQTLDLSDGKGKPAQWTVILGNNGTGKTTLLKVLASMEFNAKSHFSDDSFMFNILDPDGSFIRKTSNTFNIAFELAYNSNFIRDNNFSKEKIEKEASFYSEGKGWTWTPVQNSTLEKIPYFKFYAYGATRRLSKSSTDNKETTASLFDDKAELINAEAWLLKTHHIAKINPKFENHFELIRETLKNLLPDVTDIDVYFPDENKPELKVRFLANNIWLPLDALSLGYQSMIAWVVDLTAYLFERYPDSPNPIAEPAVVLIDEIDLHLHPEWQRKIMGYLSDKFKNTQFIVTAHSPLIVQAAEDENANIVVLERNGDEVEIKNDFSAIRGWRVDQLLASDLFGRQSFRSAKYEDLLKKRRNILGKAHLTAEDKQELQKLEEQIGDLPTAETPEDIKAMDIIRRAAKLLEAKQ